MIITKKYFTIIFAIIVSLFLIAGSASARDWDDLHEEDEKVFGSEKEMKYNPDMFFLQRESWGDHYSFMLLWLFKYTDYPKYSSLRLFPLYYGLDSKIDNRSQTVIPVTLTYWETDGNEKFRINPLFVSESTRDESGYEDIYSVSWLHGYFYTKNPKTEIPERIWWAPIIPLIYRSTDNYGGHMNIGWLLDYAWNRDKNGEENLTRFWLMPLLFHEPGDNGYTHILPPVYLHNRHSNGEYWLSLFPLFKRSKDINYNYAPDGKYKYEYEDSFKSLIFCYNSVYDDKWTGEKKISEFWFPFIPLVYSYNEKGVESHRNILWLIDWHNDANGKTDRFWFAPFYFSGSDSYRHILPPVYMNFYYSEYDNYSHLFPLYLSSRSETTAYDPESGKSISLRERLFLTPFSGYSAKTSNAETSNLDSISYWFPLLPLYYHSEDMKGTHTNLLWAFDWARDKDGKMTRFFFLPFIFHEPGEGGYRFYFPLFFRPQGWSETEGVTYSPLYYHRWSPEEDTKWSWLIHYRSDNNKTGDYINTWMPFYYHHSDPGAGETTWIMPVYYHHDGREHNGYFARIFAPVYWNIDTGKRDTTLFLPLYFETAKKNGKGSLYINILGWSRSIASGVNPVIDASLGFNEKGIYMDMDASWLIDMFSISTRFTIPMKKGQEEEFTEETETVNDADEGKVTLSKQSGVNRDSSINFWGWHLMYGLVAYEHADSKKHFRLLPLSWLTWDEKSDNKLKVILNYISYKEEETEYLVFFPFYGYQRQGESYSTGYMLNGFWHEYDHEKQLHEYTILWPIVNWYNSPDKDGWRVLPIVWHKNRVEENIRYSSTYTPLYMNKSERNAEDDSPLYRLNLSPVHFYRYNKENNESSTLWLCTIPFIFHKENETVSRFEVTSGDTGKQKNGTKEFADYTTTDTLHWIFPLYLKSEKVTNDAGKGVITSDYTLLGLPLLYYHSETEKTADESQEKKKGSIFLMGYYSEFSSENNSSSILFGLYESSKYPATGDYSYGMLYGLFNVSEMDGKYENYFRPFYYYGNDHGKKEHSALMGLYNIRRDTNNGDAHTSFLYWLFNTSLTHSSIGTSEKSIAVQERETWCIPLFYYNNVYSTTPDKTYTDRTSFSLLHFSNTYSASSYESETFWFPIIPLYFSSIDTTSTHTNILWLIDYERGIGNDYSRTWVMPVYYSRPGKDGYFHIAPFYFSSWNEEYNDKTYIIGGLYLHYMPGYTRTNFLYLYDHISRENSNYDDYSFLFGTIEYEIDPEIKRMQAFWGLLADAEWTKNGYDIESLLYLAAIERNGKYFHTRFIPFWYYESTEDTHTLVIPPALTWDSKDSDNSRFQMWALGALWFRNYEPAEHSDFQAALLGIPYYKVERAERGYESRGSLWGLLWEYETEKETGFSKFSLLKFLYKRVEMDGEVQHRVFGITF